MKRASTRVGLAVALDKVQPDGVYRIGLPRTDLKVTVDGVKVKPSFALGSYLVYLGSGGSSAMMKRDLVLTEREIEPVMLKLEQAGIEVTALHNHLIGDTAALDAAIGATGKVDGGVSKYSIAPKYDVTVGGMTLPASMGTATAFTFQPLGGKTKAAITGDFALLAAQVNPVIRALRAHDIDVTALHSHMLDAQPTVYFCTSSPGETRSLSPTAFEPVSTRWARKE
jgi:hypothetical protein